MLTAQELLLHELADIGNQLKKVLEGFPASEADRKASPQSMPAKETLAHLWECYHAFCCDARGEKYEWGAGKFEAPTFDELVVACMKTRADAVKLCETDDERILNNGVAYIVLHDGYHVGQLATLRLEIDANWNAYSIYEP